MMSDVKNGRAVDQEGEQRTVVAVGNVLGCVSLSVATYSLGFRELDYPYSCCNISMCIVLAPPAACGISG